MAFTVAAIAVAVVGAAVSAYAAYEQGQTQSAIGKYNQKLAKQQAEQKRLESEAAARAQKRKNDALLASQRALLGASGAVSSEGTPLLVQMDAAEQAALDEANVRYAGESAARNLEAEGRLYGYTAKRAERAGYIGAGASLLSGASTAVGIYGRSQRPAA